jgi:hypothetical protein
MSPEEVRACFRLYAAYRMREIGPFERMLTTLAARWRRRSFIEAFAQMLNADVARENFPPTRSAMNSGFMSVRGVRTRSRRFFA